MQFCAKAQPNVHLLANTQTLTKLEVIAAKLAAINCSNLKRSFTLDVDGHLSTRQPLTMP
jgi:hypothetical protein